MVVGTFIFWPGNVPVHSKFQTTGSSLPEPVSIMVCVVVETWALAVRAAHKAIRK
jgi:hypothetical protein